MIKFFKDLINRLPKFIFYNQKGQNVFLFATRRGGSTILSEIISTNCKKVRIIDQPFDRFDKSNYISKLRRSYLPKKNLSQFFQLDSNESIVVKKYMTKLTTGKIKSYENGLAFSFIKERAVLKILNASFISDYIKNNFDGKFVYLSRHPASQALSVMKNNWGLTYTAYLFNENWRNRYMNEKQMEISFKIHERGDYFQKCILNWVFENLYFQKFSNFEFLHINYEDIVLCTQKVKKLLSTYLGIDLGSSDLKSPSRSQKFSDDLTNKAIRENDTLFLVNKWQKELSNNQIENGQLILNIFEISNYSFFDPNPRNFSSLKNIKNKLSRLKYYQS